MKYEILDKINTPQDLKVLSTEELTLLAEEIRAFLIDATEKNGGHLASNLGIVEITLAMHRVFSSPKDHIIFDVGHQSYVHKLLTGRRENFASLRTPGGLSGFPSPKESVHDAFGTGHSSTSISAAIGFAAADKLQKNDAYSVCVIGDGAFTGGMIHEGLNNLSPDLPIVIILNENGMAITKNRGTFSDYIASYSQRKIRKGNMRALTPKGSKMLLSIAKFGEKLKSIFYSPSYFEKLGLEYIGLVDGHNIEDLENAMKVAKRLKQPVLIHAKTIKGKGNSEAERNPSEYHSLNSAQSEETFSDIFAEELISLARADKTICAVTPAMAKGTGLHRFGKEFPDRFFDTGIAEAHALTFSAAMAKSGLKPFVATYSTFLQRGYDNLIHDIALQNLPVKIIADRAGLATSDGATHHGIFDVSFFSSIPNFSLFAPLTKSSLKEVMSIAASSDSPVAIRYATNCDLNSKTKDFLARARRVNVGICADFNPENAPKYVFVTYGKILDNVISAEEFLKSKDISVGVMLTEVIKPYDFITEAIMSLSGSCQRILYVEEGIENGGAAVNTMNYLSKNGFDFGNAEYRIAAIDDNFVLPESPCDLYDFAGLSVAKILEKMLL